MHGRNDSRRCDCKKQLHQPKHCGLQAKYDTIANHDVIFFGGYSMFSGLYTALVTPFQDDKIDFHSLEKLIHHQIDSKTDGIVVCGSTGEGLLLAQQERSMLIKKSIEIADLKIKIIVGCSCASTKQALADVLVHAENRTPKTVNKKQ